MIQHDPLYDIPSPAYGRGAGVKGLHVATLLISSAHGSLLATRRRRSFLMFSVLLHQHTTR